MLGANARPRPKHEFSISLMQILLHEFFHMTVKLGNSGRCETLFTKTGKDLFICLVRNTIEVINKPFW